MDHEENKVRSQSEKKAPEEDKRTADRRRKMLELRGQIDWTGNLAEWRDDR